MRQDAFQPVQCKACGATYEVIASAAFCPGCGRRLSAAASPSVVELRDVHRSFGPTKVLNGLTLEVPQGESLVIVGMSGSGKSVLMEHIIGFLSPDSGTVRVLGVETTGSTSEAARDRLREQLGMVFQGPALIDSLTVRENIILPLTSRGHSPAEAEQRADELLAAVGLPDDAGSLAPMELSGGMQKRVGIARALVSLPTILLYDEPTTGLDAATSTRISKLMRDVQRRRPELTAIVITHDYLSAGIIADRVLYLDRTTGRLQTVLSRESIAKTRQRHGDDEQAAVSEIRAQLEEFFNRLDFTDRPGGADGRRAQSWASAFSNVLGAAFHMVGAAAATLCKAGWNVHWPAVLRRAYQLGFQSLPIMCAAGAFVGMMLTLQIGVSLADTGMLDPLPGVVGVTLVEKIGALVTGLLFAGRAGASISAEIGGKRLSRQFDALRAMAVSPERYWLLPALVAAALVTPLLTVALEASALGGAYAVAVYRYHVKSSFFLDQMLQDVSLPMFLFGLLRSLVFGMAVVLFAYVKGAENKRSSDEIGYATTIAVSACSLCVIALDFVMVFVVSSL